MRRCAGQGTVASNQPSAWVRHVLRQSIHPSIHPPPSRWSYISDSAPIQIKVQVHRLGVYLNDFHVYEALTSPSFMSACPCQHLTYPFPGSNIRCRVLNCSLLIALPPLPSSSPLSFLCPSQFPLLVPISRVRRATRIDQMWHVRMRRTRT